MVKLTKKQVSSKIGLVRAIVNVLSDKQAEQIRVLCVEKQTVLCNYFVICTGRANVHVRALADALDEELSKVGKKPAHTEGMSEGRWVVEDFSTVIVHIFDRASRDFYNLENLWRDSKEIKPKELLSEQ